MKLIYTLCALALTNASALGQDKAPEAPKTSKVDTELLFLVEVPGKLSTQDFSTMMKSYSNAIQSASVIQAIQAGSTGSIAASLIFYGGSAQQVVGVNWTKLNSKESLSGFAEAISISSEKLPFTSSGTSIGNALDTALSKFSTSNENGFSSDAKIIDITGFNVSDPAGKGSIISSADADKAARDSILTKGVTSVNGLSIGGEETAAYFKENVTGGENSFILAADPGELEKVMASKISTEINNANASVAPEPSSTALLGLGALALVLRRKR